MGSAIVIYGKPLVLRHGFIGTPFVRVSVPFRRLRKCTTTQAELRRLEQELGEAIYAGGRKKNVPSNLIVLEHRKFEYGAQKGAAIPEDFGQPEDEGETSADSRVVLPKELQTLM